MPVPQLWICSTEVPGEGGNVIVRRMGTQQQVLMSYSGFQDSRHPYLRKFMFLHSLEKSKTYI